MSLISRDLSLKPDKKVIVRTPRGPTMGRDSELGQRRASTLLLSKVICSLTSRLTTAWIVEVLKSDETSAVSKSGHWKMRKETRFSDEDCDPENIRNLVNLSHGL